MAVTLTSSGVNFSDGTSQSSAGSWSKAGNGYVKLLSGIILQWGVTSAINGDTSQNISFPIAFPNACTSLSATPQVDNAQRDNWGMVLTFNTSSANICRGFTGNNSTGVVYWMAIGY